MAAVVTRSGVDALEVGPALISRLDDERPVTGVGPAVVDGGDRAVLRGPQHVWTKPAIDEQREERSHDVRDRRHLLTLEAEHAEAVGREEKSAQRLALEQGLALGVDFGELLLQVAESGSLAFSAAAILAFGADLYSPSSA